MGRDNNHDQPSIVATDDLLDRIVELARPRSEGARGDEIELFLRHYYRRLPTENIQGRDAEDLYFSALGMLNFMRSRTTGHDKLRVYNPSLDADGWSSPHKVIDLVTDDRPFLVDSLTATWADANPDIISRNAQLFTDLRTQPGMDLAMLAVANCRMRELITG